MHKKQSKQNFNVYSRSNNDLHKYRHKSIKKNMIIIIIGIIILVIVIAIGIGKYSKSTNNTMPTQHAQKSSQSLSNTSHNIPLRFCGTYTYSLSTNKYYHVNMLWHLTSKHVYQQLVVIRNKKASNTSLKNARLNWNNNKQKNKSKKHKHALQWQIKRTHNLSQKKHLKRTLYKLNKHQYMIEQPQHSDHTSVSARIPQKHANKHVHQKPVTQNGNIPANIVAQMSHISHLAENYNEAYNVKKVNIGNNVMNLTLSMNTKVVSKINTQLSKYINVRQIYNAAPHVGINKLKFQNDNLIYRNKIFENIPQNIAKKIIDKNDFTQYWAGY